MFLVLIRSKITMFNHASTEQFLRVLWEAVSWATVLSLPQKKTFAIIGYLLIISINRTLWDRFSKTALRPLRMKAVWLSQPSTCSLAVLSFPYPGTEYEGSSSADKYEGLVRCVLGQLGSRYSLKAEKLSHRHFHNSCCLVGRMTQLQEEPEAALDQQIGETGLQQCRFPL